MTVLIHHAGAGCHESNLIFLRMRKKEKKKNDFIAWITPN